MLFVVMLGRVGWLVVLCWLLVVVGLMFDVCCWCLIVVCWFVLV